MLPRKEQVIGCLDLEEKLKLDEMGLELEEGRMELVLIHVMFQFKVMLLCCGDLRICRHVSVKGRFSSVD